MIRKSRLIVLACLLLIPPAIVTAAEPGSGGEASQGSSPAAPSDCSGVWCTTVVPGIAAIAYAAFSQRTDDRVAQGKGPGLVVAPVTLAEPATQTRLRVQIGSGDALPKNTLIRLRGLPAAVSVPQGHFVAAGVWAVSVRSLEELSVDVPRGLLGWSDVKVALVTTEGEVLAQSRTKLVVAPAF
jgi:hypothetical protein